MKFWQSIAAKHKTTILYGIVLACLLFILKWLEYKLLIAQHLLEIYTGLIALLFTGLGVWLALKLAKPKKETIVIEREVLVPQIIEVPTPTIAILQPEGTPQATDISKRELEVLQLMATGLSNNEIAESLYVSLSTVKTHVSNIYIKLDVKRRTQAVEKAKRMSLIA